MAGLTLNKGGNLSLDKAEPGIERALLGLGWDARSTSGYDFDLDASALLVNRYGKVRSDADFVFYNQMGDVTLPGSKLPDPDRASVRHTGDNRTGEGDGDDEAIEVDLSRIPADVDKVVFVVSIHEAVERGQNFGQVRNAFIRLVNRDNDREVVRYDLSEDYSRETAMIFAELYRHEGEWKFRAVGQGYNSGLRGVALDFGVDL